MFRSMDKLLKCGGRLQSSWREGGAAFFIADLILANRERYRCVGRRRAGYPAEYGADLQVLPFRMPIRLTCKGALRYHDWFAEFWLLPLSIAFACAFPLALLFLLGVRLAYHIDI